MKIGILLDRLTLGGVAKVGIEEVRNLIKLGHEAYLLVLFKGKGDENCYEDIRTEVPTIFLSERYPFPFNHSVKFPLFSFFSTFHLSSVMVAPGAIKGLGLDALIVHGTYTCFSAMRVHKVLKIPYLAYIWDPISYVLPKAYSSAPLRRLFPILLPVARRLDRAIAQHASGLITSLKDHQALLERLSQRRPYLVSPGCYPVDEPPPKRGDHILALTKWVMGKRPEFLLQVLKRLKKKPGSR